MYSRKTIFKETSWITFNCELVLLFQFIQYLDDNLSQASYSKLSPMFIDYSRFIK